MDNHVLNQKTEPFYNLQNQLFDEFATGLYVGVMSGTSLDGMDAVLVQFLPDPTAQINIIASHRMNFSKPLQQILLALCQPNGCQQLAHEFDDFQKTSSECLLPKTLFDKTLLDNVNVLSELDWAGWAGKEYAEQASQLVQALIKKAQKVSDAAIVDRVMAIGCHGQTVRHRPQFGFSTQLMDANILAERTGINVVSDFRRRDMAVGGQGAPLVPAFHHAMFADEHQWRVVVNLGGIANITVLPPLTLGQVAYGYDTGPANLLLDGWMIRHSNASYDDGGQFARSGQLIEPLLEQLLKHDYFAKSAPKSTGREDFNLSWLDAQLQSFAEHYPDVRYCVADVQNTLTELTAISVAAEINRIHQNHGLSGEQATKIAVFACGGGAYNTYLLERMALHISYLFADKIASTEQLGLSATWVEATAFAWLAKQTLMGQTGNLPSVTGANKSVVLGQVCFA